jgi:hypothetical protein
MKAELDSVWLAHIYKGDPHADMLVLIDISKGLQNLNATLFFSISLG